MPASKPDPLLRRARTAYFGFPYDSEQRRMIEYIDRRLSAPDPLGDDDTARHERSSRAMLAARLTDIIRPRIPGGFA